MLYSHLEFDNLLLGKYDYLMDFCYCLVKCTSDKLCEHLWINCFFVLNKKLNFSSHILTDYELQMAVKKKFVAVLERQEKKIVQIEMEKH